MSQISADDWFDLYAVLACCTKLNPLGMVCGAALLSSFSPLEELEPQQDHFRRSWLGMLLLRRFSCKIFWQVPCLA
jgi:hypothetical protein